MGVERIEQFLSKHIEGFFNRQFSSNLELAELVSSVEREIASKAKGKHARIPTAFLFSLESEDYHRLYAQSVFDTLYLAAAKAIILYDASATASLVIRLKEDTSIQRGRYELHTSGPEEEDTAQTLVLEKEGLMRKASEMRPMDYLKFAMLSVLTGPDRDIDIELGTGDVHIGRKEQNELILTDANVSRTHAWIAYERHRHILHDANSTNGTFVNNERVRSACLREGDIIRMGESTIRYEVI